MLAALEPEPGALEQRAAGHLDRGVLDLEHDAAGAARVGEGERQSLARLRVGLDLLHLAELLRARGRLARARAGAEAGDEPLEPLDLRLLALDGAAEGELARRLLLAPRVPRALEELAAAALELEHGRADGLEEPAVVGHEDDGGVDRLEALLEPLERLHVEVVGRLVEQQQVGVAGQRAGQRSAGELAARERAQRAVEVGDLEAEAADHAERALAPVVAAGVLEPGLGAPVLVVGLLVAGAVGHLLLELGQPLLDRDQVGAAGQHVVAQGQVAVARRALVVQGDAGVLLEDELAAVDPGLAGEHAQQRGLARAVAPGQGHALAALELERDPAHERVPRHVLGEVGCDQYGHRQTTLGAAGRCGQWTGGMPRGSSTRVRRRAREL